MSRVLLDLRYLCQSDQRYVSQRKELGERSQLGGGQWGKSQEVSIQEVKILRSNNRSPKTVALSPPPPQWAST